MEDKDLWGQYARGVKKFGEKADPESVTKESKETQILARDRTTESGARPKPSLSLDTMPEAWRCLIEGEPSISRPDPPSITAISEAPPPAPSGLWKKEPLDVRIERNLSLGDVFIESKLDLHGQTEAEAHARFLAYIDRQQNCGRRLVLVITGKGRDGHSVLRANLPRWCDVPPLDDKVWAIRTAVPLHGGDGAYYVLLRKKNT